MIEKTFAKEQVQRMLQLDGFPMAENPINELVLAAQIADTAGICITVLDDIMRLQTKCPKPADLRSAMVRANEAQGIGETKARKDCHTCHGTGWRFAYALWTRENGRVVKERLSESQADSLLKRESLGKNQTIYAGSEKCLCRV